jgi:hypothetical protein
MPRPPDRPSMTDPTQTRLWFTAPRRDLDFLRAGAWIMIVVPLAGLLLLSGAPLHAQSSPGAWKQPCSIQYPGRQPVRFNCRWMHSAVTGGTIFVDNSDTGERYVVDHENTPSGESRQSQGTASSTRWKPEFACWISHLFSSGKSAIRSRLSGLFGVRPPRAM